MVKWLLLILEFILKINSCLNTVISVRLSSFECLINSTGFNYSYSEKYA